MYYVLGTIAYFDNDTCRHMDSRFERIRCWLRCFIVRKNVVLFVHDTSCAVMVVWGGSPPQPFQAKIDRVTRVTDTHKKRKVPLRI